MKRVMISSSIVMSVILAIIFLMPNAFAYNTESNFHLNDVFLQSDSFGLRNGPLGSADPIIVGVIPSILGVLGFAVTVNLFNAAVRRKMVDQEKLSRIMKETKAWQKERMSAFRSKDNERIVDLNKKSSYMNKLSMEMMQMNMRPMMITIVPLLLIFYLVLPHLFSYTIAVSPISLNIFPGNFFHLTCTAEQVDGVICKQENEIYLWGWYFLSSIALSGIIMKITKTSMSM